MIEILQCTEDKVISMGEEHNLMLNWGQAVNPFMVNIDNKTVAMLDLSKGTVYGENTIWIHKFEVIKKGEGIGTKVISYLTKNLEGIGIYLHAGSEASKNFWIKSGFESFDDGGVEAMCFPKKK